MRKFVTALLSGALVFTSLGVAPAMADDPPCDLTIDRPYEKRTSQGYVKVTGNFAWSCDEKPQFGEAHAYLQWRNPGQTTWITKHHAQRIQIDRSGTLTTEYLPCQTGYHRIFYSISWRVGTEIWGKSGGGPAIYADCRP